MKKLFILVLFASFSAHAADTGRASMARAMGRPMPVTAPAPAPDAVRAGSIAGIPVNAPTPEPIQAEVAIVSQQVMAAPRSNAAEVELGRLTMERDSLKAEIAQLDSEMSRCRKQKTGWTAATVVGGVGTVATGIGALVQHKKIQEKKSDVGKKTGELGTATNELNSLK